MAEQTARPPHHKSQPQGRPLVEVWRRQPVLEMPADEPAQVLAAIGHELYSRSAQGGSRIVDRVEFDMLGHHFTVEVEPLP